MSSRVMTTARGVPSAAHSSHSVDGDRVDLVRCRHHEQRGIGRPQPGPQLAGEVRVARGVHEVHDNAVVAEWADRQGDGPLLGDLDRIGIADRRSLRDGSGSGDRPGGREQSLDQGRLPRAGMAYQRDVADLLRAVGRLERAHRRALFAGGLLGRHQGHLHEIRSQAAWVSPHIGPSLHSTPNVPARTSAVPRSVTGRPAIVSAHHQVAARAADPVGSHPKGRCPRAQHSRPRMGE